MSDHSIAALSIDVTAAAMTAAPSVDDAGASFSITESMISYLRMEANQAEDKAKRLRKQAANIAEQFGITQQSQFAYGTRSTRLYLKESLYIPDSVGYCMQCDKLGFTKFTH